MAKIIDYISLTIILFILSFTLLTLAFDNFVVAMIIACVISAIVSISIYKFSKGKGNPYTYSRLELEFCLNGNKYVIDLILSVLKNGQNERSIIKNDVFENGDNYILLENSLIIANFKFSALNLADISTICNFAKIKGFNKVFLLTKGVDRRAYQVAELKGVKIAVVKTSKIFKFLKKHNALPDLKKIKRKGSIKYLLDIALSRNNFKSYAFSGIVLILSSFLTPLRIYYLVFGTLSLALALLTLTPLGHGHILSQKAFDDIDDIIAKDKAINQKNVESNDNTNN